MTLQYNVDMYLDELPDIRDVQFSLGRKALDQKGQNYVLYCRKSEERDDRTSLPAQEDQCMELARREGLNILGVIKEQMSARRYGRPKFTNLLNAIKDKEELTCIEGKKKVEEHPDGIIAWHPDRLARNMRDAGEIIELLDCGLLVDLKFPVYAFHNDSSGKEHLAMEFARAKGYSDHLQDNVLRGTMAQEMKGRGTRPLPPAFEVVQDTDSPDFLKIVPSHLHEHWRNVYQWKLEGKTNNEIAVLLKMAGYTHTKKKKTKKGTVTYNVKIDEDYIGRHIKNSLHCGWLVSGEKSKEPRRADLNELYPTEFNGEPFPLVVTVADFKKVNPHLFSDTAKKPRPKKRTDRTLAGRVFCKILLEAGKLSTMVANVPTGGSGKPSPRFSCQRCRPRHSIGTEHLFVAVEKELKKVKITEREHKLLVVTEWSRYEREREQEEATRRQIASIKGKNADEIIETRETLNSMKYGKSRASEKEIAVEERKLERLESEQKTLIEREQSLNEESLERYHDLDAFLELAKNASRWWKKANDDQKRKMAEILISHVVVEGNEVASVSLAEPFVGWSKREKTNGGGAGGSRTPDILLAKQALWPTELQPHNHCGCFIHGFYKDVKK